MLNRMRQYAPFLVKFEDEQSVEFRVSVAHAEPFGYLIDGSVVAVVQGPSILTLGWGLGLSARFPAHDEALVVDAFGRGGAVFDHALAEYDKFDVADDGNAAPGYRCGPKRGMVGDAAGDGGEVRVGGGEEVEGYVRGEYFLRQGRGEESGEMGLECSEG